MNLTSFLRNGLACAAIFGLAQAPAMAESKWPERPVNLIVIAGAGGGSDFTIRTLARELEDITGQRFNIINQPQGGGVVGMTSYVNAKPDGYTLGQLSTYAQYTLLGQAKFTADSFTPLGQFNADPSAIHVSADSAIKDTAAIVAALKQDPASLRISCGGTCNASWDIPFVSMLMDQGVDVAQLNLIPAQGSAAGLQELVSGGLDIVLSSVPETDALTEAGHVRTVAVINGKRLQKYPDIPTVGEQLGKDFEGGTWRALAGPAGIDAATASRIEVVIQQAYDTPRFQEAMRTRGFETRWRNAAELQAFLQQHETETGEVLQALQRLD